MSLGFFDQIYEGISFAFSTEQIVAYLLLLIAFGLCMYLGMYLLGAVILGGVPLMLSWYGYSDYGLVPYVILIFGYVLATGLYRVLIR